MEVRCPHRIPRHNKLAALETMPHGIVKPPQNHLPKKTKKTMKKSLIILSLAALFGASSLSAADNNENNVSTDNSSVVTETNESETNGAIYGYWYGRIGGYSASLSMDGYTGYVSMEGSGDRTLKLKSYSGNKLVINAYLRGKYIGYYSGTLDRYGNYKGTFFNKNGGKVTFELYPAGD